MKDSALGRLAWWTCFAVLLLGFSSATVVAQGRRSGITGVARDASGGVLPNVQITVKNVETGVIRQAKTDAAGLYRVLQLDPGMYNVSAELAGFRTFVRTNVELTLEREAVVDTPLSLGDVSQDVTVTGDAAQVDTSASTLASLVNRQTIVDLPLNGRDYIQLATLEPGIHVARAQGGGANTGQGLQISIGGGRPVQNNFRLDGTSITDQTGSTPGSLNGVNLGVDSIREFSVIRSTANAQYGRSAGGVVNAISRSGTNQFHGTLFEFLRNSDLDARNFFDGDAPPEFRRNQYGGSVGGPIQHDKTFFFVNYEALRQVQGNTTIDTTLSDNARAGILTTGNVTVNPIVAKVLSFYPHPNGQLLGDVGIFSFTNPTSATEQFLTSRLDRNFGAKGSLFARYSFDLANSAQDSDFAVDRVTSMTRTHTLTLDYTRALTGAVLNSARFGLMRSNNVNSVTHSLVSGVDDPSLAFVPGQAGLGLIQVGGLTQFPGGSGGLDHDLNHFTSFQYYDDVSWTRGAHSIKIGAALERTRFNTDSQSQASGLYVFNTLSTFLTNRPDQFTALLPGGADTIRGWRQFVVSWYVQDDWRLSSHLTLNIGVRYEMATVPNEVHNLASNLDQITSPTITVGNPMFNNPSKKNFAPRVGLVWDPFGKGKTAIRAAYGIFDDLVLSQFVINAGVRNPPFYARGTVSSLPVGSFPSGGIALLTSATLRAERIPRDFSQPYVQQYNLNIQQQLASDLSMTLAYAGSRGVHLSAIVEDANLAIPTVTASGQLFFPATGSRQNPNFAMIRNRLFDGDSFYNSLQTSLKKRWSHGFQFVFAYTLGKSIDDDSSTFSHDEASNAIGIPINGNHKFNRGLSTFDVHNNVVFSITWDVPGPTNGLARQLLGGWQLGTILAHESGLPFSATLGYDAARTKTGRANRQGGQRPDLSPSCSNDPVTGNPLQWFTPTCFLAPTAGFLGNLGRNTMIGPARTDLDLSLVKQFRLRESWHLDFRSEFFNALNHTSFNLPPPGNMQVLNSATQYNPAAGLITSAAASREIQFGLKLIF